MALDTNFNANITGAVESLVSAEKLQLANAIFTSSYEVGEFGSKHNVLTDVRNGHLIPIITRGNKYGALSASNGDCSMNECDLDSSFANKKWILGEYDCRIPICLKSYSDDFKLFFKMYNQTLEDPLTEPDKDVFFAYAIQEATEKLNGALWRTGYWGDTTSSNGLISENNGFWTEADAGDGVKQTLPAGELTGQQVYDKLAKMYVEASNYSWFKEAKFKFVVTRKMARTLVTWLNGLTDKSMYNCDCIDPNKVVSDRVFGIDNLRLFGLPVVSYDDVDEAGKALGVTPDYRALLIADDNMLIGVNTAEHLDQFDIFFEKKDRKIYIDLAIQIGASIPLDEYVYATQSAVVGG